MHFIPSFARVPSILFPSWCLPANDVAKGVENISERHRPFFKRFHFVLLLFLLLRVNTRHPSSPSHSFVERRRRKKKNERKKGERKGRKGKERKRGEGSPWRPRIRWLIGRWQGYAFLASLRICPHCHFNFNPLGANRRWSESGVRAVRGRHACTLREITLTTWLQRRGDLL